MKHVEKVAFLEQYWIIILLIAQERGSRSVVHIIDCSVPRWGRAVREQSIVLESAAAVANDHNKL